MSPWLGKKVFTGYACGVLALQLFPVVTSTVGFRTLTMFLGVVLLLELAYPGATNFEGVVSKVPSIITVSPA